MLGDVHCEASALSTALAHFRALPTDAIVAVGDLLDGAEDANRTLGLLRDAGVLAVAGNHDRWWLDRELRDLPNATPLGALEPDNRAYLAALPRTRTLETVRGALLVCHGIGANDFVGIKPDLPDTEALAIPELCALLGESRYAFLLNGHTHRPMLRRFPRADAGTLTVLNAGTLHRDYRPVCSVLDLAAGSVQFFDVSAAGLRPAALWRLDQAEPAALPLGQEE